LSRSPGRLPRSRLASVALRVSERLAPQILGRRARAVEGAQDYMPVIPSLAQLLKGRDAVLVAAHRLAVDQARAHPQTVHRLDDQRITAASSRSIRREAGSI
jgi:hypothetical protein